MRINGRQHPSRQSLRNISDDEHLSTEFAPNEILFEEHKRVPWIHYLESGWVKMTVQIPENGTNQSGERSCGLGKLIWIACPGTYLGVDSVLRNEAAQYTALAAQLCRTRLIKPEAFLRQLATDLSFCRTQLRRLALQQRCWLEVAVLSRLAPSKRVEHLLWALTEHEVDGQFGQRVRFKPPVRQLELASLVDLSPESFDRELLALQSANVIDRSDGCEIVIADRRKLWHLED